MSNAVTFLSVLNAREFTDLVRQHRPLLTPAQAAAYLAVSVRTLEVWRAAKSGPAYDRIGPKHRLIRYHLDALEAYAAPKD